MIELAHIGPVPVEEMLIAMPAVAALLGAMSARGLRRPFGSADPHGKD
ncbi:MAG: hypothetical protein M3Y45_09620 [Actinomycetota bacterium]|nr:hypothetical protein [Actinomycetota bacterium]